MLQCLGLLESIGAAHGWVREALVARGLHTELLAHHLCNVPPRLAAQATRLLCMLCESNGGATEEVGTVLSLRLELVLANFGRARPEDGTPRTRPGWRVAWLLTWHGDDVAWR